MSVHDRWRGAKTGPGKRWEVRWRQAGRQCKRRFAVRQAAERFEAKRKLEPEQRLTIEGRLLTVDQLMATWLATKQGLRPTTLDAYRVDARETLATFTGRLASSVRPSEIRLWTARPRGVSRRRRALVALGQAYRIALADGLLSVSPCAGIPLPKGTTKEPRYLTWFELRDLAEAAGDSGPLVWLLGTTGLRLGEVIGLQVGDVGPRRIRVRRSVSTTSRGLVEGPPKSGKPRDVPVPPFVAKMLPVDARESGEWLFVGPRGGRLDPHNWRRRVFQTAAERAGLAPLHPHALRHTAASLAIRSGADVLAVQAMLGHASLVTTQIYSHLHDTGLDEVAERMSEGALRSQQDAKRRTWGAVDTPLHATESHSPVSKKRPASPYGQGKPGAV